MVADSGPVVRATPLNQAPSSNSNVAFVTRTSDDSQKVKGATVPGFRDETALEALPLDNTPCTLKGLSGGFAAGLLGYVFGFVPSMLRNRSLKSMHVWGADGMSSFKAFFVMSGVYTTVQCICERIRQQDDGLNRIIAGGASGVAVAWKSGLWGALQSGLLLAAVSWVFDFGTGAAKASSISGRAGSCAAGGSGCSVASVGQLLSVSYGADGPGSEARGSRPVHVTLGAGCVGGRRRQGQAAGGWAMLRRPEEVLRTPVVMWLGPIANRAYFSPPAMQLTAHRGS
ncbi:hypothetical protein HYH02_013576 [Chlamydomonas schloesseri]|uniref:Mitochondrial import inner membrane translocase subunit TIM22 n=1 Tax=Chlamydomonas schloesseri TaxID=2026947 RepID=A0A835VVD2_9CHLO|nr:hypothetical protein HYH02_013576 [Chlamydomonas schloesseri]|eukprot:KAG2430737.1 hypothetical protein HYH02_013576 [Chlamydomonas schloesseri]